MKKRQTHWHTEKLRSGDLSSLMEKLQHPGSSLCLLYTFVQEGGLIVYWQAKRQCYYIPLNKEAGLLYTVQLWGWVIANSWASLSNLSRGVSVGSVFMLWWTFPVLLSTFTLRKGKSWPSCWPPPRENSVMPTCHSQISKNIYWELYQIPATSKATAKGNLF